MWAKIVFPQKELMLLRSNKIRKHFVQEKIKTKPTPIYINKQHPNIPWQHQQFPWKSRKL